MSGPSEKAAQDALLRQRLQAFERNRQGLPPPSLPAELLAKVERMEEHEQRYANTILLLGYGGFFALWASTAGEMPRSWFGAAGLLMAFSLLVFILHTLARTVAVGTALRRTGPKPGVAFDPIKALEEVNQAAASVNRWWLPVFLLSAIPGLIAAGVLLWFFGVAVMANEWQEPKAAAARATVIEAPSPAPR